MTWGSTCPECGHRKCKWVYGNLCEVGVQKMIFDGYRILAPGQLDPYTIERCAEVAEDHDGHFSVWGQDSNTRIAQQTCADIAAAIRELAKGPDQK